jgi:hypothetical protein
MRKKIMLTFLAAAMLALPAGALADKGGGGNGKSQATYQLKGTLSAYTAAVGTTPGSITILVSKGNNAGRPFVGQTLTFATNAATKVSPRGAAIANGDQGSVQLKGAAGLTAAGLQALVPRHVQDETAGGGDD